MQQTFPGWLCEYLVLRKKYKKLTRPSHFCDFVSFYQEPECLRNLHHRLAMYSFKAPQTHIPRPTADDADQNKCRHEAESTLHASKVELLLTHIYLRVWVEQTGEALKRLWGRMDTWLSNGRSFEPLIFPQVNSYRALIRRGTKLKGTNRGSQFLRRGMCQKENQLCVTPLTRPLYYSDYI